MPGGNEARIGERLGGTAVAVGVAPDLIACHDCGFLHRIGPLPDGAAARCVRCDAVLYRHRVGAITVALALSLTSLILYIIANVLPFMTFKMEGRQEDNVLISGVFAFFEQGIWELGVTVFLVLILFPLLKIVGYSIVLAAAWRHRISPSFAPVLRWVETLQPWAMMEIFLLGVFVAYVKLIDFATIELNTGFYAFIALILVMVAADAAHATDDVWERIKPRRQFRPLSAPPVGRLSCHACTLVVEVPAADSHAPVACPRCGETLHDRKRDSINRTWALVITAALLYIPANVFPVMTVISFGRGEPDTIISGVIELAAAGMWPIAALVFFASITVPVLKLLGLSFLLISVQTRSRWRLKDRTVLFRIIEGIGRWSMIDIFMISILIALVKLEAIATIVPGVGAIAFAGVVIITMIASAMFDPRLMWDAAEEPRERSVTVA